MITMVANCVLFAAWRYLTRGGYVVITKSKYGWWPHVLWSPDLITFEQFQPRRPRRWYTRALRWGVPPVLFDGQPKPWRPDE